MKWGAIEVLTLLQNMHVEALTSYLGNSATIFKHSAYYSSPLLQSQDKASIADAESTPVVWTVNTMKAAARAGELATIVWLREHEHQCPWDSDVIDIAAENNDIELLKYLRSDTLVVDGQDRRCPWSVFACARAALEGHLEVQTYPTYNSACFINWTRAD